MKHTMAVVALPLILVLTGGCATPRSAHKGTGLCEVLIEVTDIDDGVTAKITSQKPERVKMIQEHWAQKQEANRKARQEGSCGCKHRHAEGCKACKCAHACGKCPGHKQ
jgi:hypothetical protein